MSDITSELLQKWTGAVKGGDAKQVISLYHEDGILWEHFLVRKELGTD